MGDAGKLLYPVIAVNDAETKWDFDNVYGTGQSSIDGILRATSILLAGKTFVVAGYGHCGRGVASRAAGPGRSRGRHRGRARSSALRAMLDGFEVMPMDEAAKLGDVFITATGVKDVIVKRHFESMKDGAVVCNTGHYDCEINMPELAAQAKSRAEDPGQQRRVHDEGRAAHLPAGQGQAREPRRRRRASFRGHGHVVRQPVPLPRTALQGGQGNGKEGVRHRSRAQDKEIASVKLAQWAEGSTPSPPSRSPTSRISRAGHDRVSRVPHVRHGMFLPQTP